MKTKTCQNCKKAFAVSEQEQNILQKMSLPLPAFCAECSMIERMLWRNERTLSKRPNMAPGKTGDIISMYAAHSDIIVYDSKSWWEDSWDSGDYAREYDFSRPFFEQFKELLHQVPFPALQNWNAVNSDYCNCTADNKNCYLVFGGDFNEDSMYSMYNIYCKNVADVYWLEKSEFCYEVIFGERCYRVMHAKYVRDCTDSSFIYDCANCTHCTGCVGLRNRSYCILNEQYTKEGYAEALAALRLDTHSGQEAFRAQVQQLRAATPTRFAYLIKTEHCTGDRITNSKDCVDCFDITGPAESLADCINGGWGLKDALRSSQVGYGAELIYNSFGVFSSAQFIICSAYVPSSMNVSYSYNCPNGSNLFGCVGVKKGNYMILNKQYSKEEYNELLPKIRQHMADMPYADGKGRVYSYGEFFPGELSPFAYNESVAQDLKTLTEDEILALGYSFHARDHAAHSVTVTNESMPDALPETFAEVKQEIFECTNRGDKVYCARAFKIIPEEFAFYQRMGIPLPRYCFNCRHYERFAEIKSFQLREQACHCAGASSDNGAYANTAVHSHGAGECPVIFKTAYPADPDKILYCEGCYQQEIL